MRYYDRRNIMNQDLITQEEIDHIKSNAVTIDILPDFPPINHLSVGHKNGNPDPADAEYIAKRILGSDYIVFGTLYNQETQHFYSCTEIEKLKTILDRIRSKTNKNTR
jgi:hypothetical protein